MDETLKEEEKDVKNIEEPLPGPNHLHCAICSVNFQDYYQHIFSSAHKASLRIEFNVKIIQEIDKVIIEVNQDQNKKL